MSLFSTDKSELIMWVMDHYGVRYRESKRGWQKVSCFLHRDRNPSASLNIGTGYYHCFSCQKAGDGYELLHDLEGWDVKKVNEVVKLEPERDDIDESDVWV